jgi:hypothetical protein
MRNSMGSWRAGAALAVSVGALSLSSLPHTARSAGTTQKAGSTRWFDWFADGQKVAEQTGKPLFVIIT